MKAKVEIMLEQGIFDVESRYLKEYYAGELKSFERPHFAFRIVVRRIDTQAPLGLPSISFTFHESQAHWQKNIRKMDEHSISFAFYCLLSDALIGTGTYKDFLSEFGYEDSGESRRIYRACQKQLDKLLSLRVSENEIPDMLNEMQDKYPHYV